jgi:hypothetical protein
MCLACSIYEGHRHALQHIASSPRVLLLRLEASEICFYLAYKQHCLMGHLYDGCVILENHLKETGRQGLHSSGTLHGFDS